MSKQLDVVRAWKWAGNERVEYLKTPGEYPGNYYLAKTRKEAMRLADYKCAVCGCEAKEVHHIDKIRSNHKVSNLLAVCRKCHKSLHKDDREKSKYKRLYGRDKLALVQMLDITHYDFHLLRDQDLLPEIIALKDMGLL